MRDKFETKLVKKWACLALAVLLVCGSGTALAEPSETLKKVAGGFQSLSAVPNTHYLLAKSSKSSSWGLIDSAGKQLCPYKFPYLSYLSYGCLQASRYEVSKKHPLLNERSANRLALVALDGTMISDYAYGYFQIYNEYWAGAWVLEPGTEEDSDYQADKAHFFRLVRCDLFFLGTPEGEAPRLVSSFARDEFLKASGHGRYLSVQDRQERVTILEPDGTAHETQNKMAADGVYQIRYLTIVNSLTDEMIAEGYSGVKEVQTANGLLLVGTRTDYSGAKTNSILDLAGQELMAETYASVSAISGDYVLLKKDELFGLYSLKENRELLPCDYDEILLNKNGVDPYVSRGYLGAVKDGECHIISAATGETVRIFVRKAKWEMLGLLYYRQTKSQLHYYSPVDGHHEDPLGALESKQGSGYLLAVKIEGRHYVVNWQGKTLMKGSRDAYAVTPDDSVIVKTDSGYELYRLVSK